MWEREFEMSDRFAQEPSYRHGQANKIGIVWCNLGTPDAPTASALRRYLAQFLGDPRVVEIPRLVWLPILHGIILRLRPAKSAAKYASIWTEQGSPLLHGTLSQAQALQTRFDPERVMVRPAMRYGSPALPTVLDEMRSAGVNQLLVLSAYPQYSATTTASVWDDVCQWMKRHRNLPEMRWVKHYHDHPKYIEALAAQVRRHWQTTGRQAHLVMSFHGVPQRTLELGDPYHCECHKTGRLLAQALSLKPDQYTLTFQSRFGKAKWLEPYTEPTVKRLAQEGHQALDVICPGFVTDCLETLEEIAMEVQAAFLESGGSDFGYIPCLNSDPSWIDALVDIASTHLHGWNISTVSNVKELDEQRVRALALGAKN
jgi:ferrochelatase